MADIASVFGRHEFLIRRLHSLTGLVPVGAFLVVHLLTNMGILDNSYQERVNLIHSMGERTLEVTEWGLIFLPLLFHGIIGLIIVARGKRNLTYYPYPENFRYTLQRWTGVIAFAFILWHVFQTRGWINTDWWLHHVTQPLGGGLFDPKQAVTTGVEAVQQAGVGRARLCHRHSDLGLPLFQRPVDDGHYLGRLDRPRRNGGPRSSALPWAWRWPERGWQPYTGSGSFIQ